MRPFGHLLVLIALIGAPLQAGSQLIPYREGGDYYQPEPQERYHQPQQYPNNDGPSFGTVPRSSSDQEARCDAAYRAYQESQDCFNRFRNANGSVRGDAYRYCREVRDPSPQCGPPRNW